MYLSTCSPAAQEPSALLLDSQQVLLLNVCPLVHSLWKQDQATEGGALTPVEVLATGGCHSNSGTLLLGKVSVTWPTSRIWSLAADSTQFSLELKQTQVRNT